MSGAISFVARANELFEMHPNPREMGLGGAFISAVDDEESLWFNPAGIARTSGLHWTIADPRAGISNPTDLQTLSKLQTQSSFNSTLASLYGKPIWAGAGAKSAVIMPGLELAYYLDGDASIIADNPVDPTMTVNYVEDQGIAVGSGWSIADVLEMGFDAKYITRTGVREDFGPDTLANIISGSQSPSVIFNNLNNKGTGIAFDFGANLTVPGPVKPTLSLVWKDFGNTTFRPTTALAPPSDPSDLRIGGSLLLDAGLVSVMPIVEMREVNDASIQLGKKLHAGVELGLPLIDLRAGLYQGYLTYGFGMNFGLIHIDAASWGTEVGGAPGQMESRRYIVQATLRLGFDFFGGESSKSGGQHSDSFFNFGGSSDSDYVKVRR